ncbi:MAG: shikimate dehydrogenase, partial [Elusimicrobiota bacterium]|nr:shikimate dehydrogenase [Elusimicrobiota bacterium]
MIKINSETKILGIFGNPIKHSLSPCMHNSAIKFLDLNYVYIPFWVTGDIKTAVKAIKDMNFAGVNVTIPYKEKVIPFLNELTNEADKIGAVNTIINDDGRLIGDNTDGIGFIYSLKNDLKFNVNTKKCFMFGAGGAARAIAVSLIFAGAENIFITDINIEKSKNLAKISKEIIVIDINNVVEIAKIIK